MLQIHQDLLEIQEGIDFQFPDIIKQIGNTPLIQIKLPEFSHLNVFAKAEWMNPGGSVKDRAALNMILYGYSTGKIDKKKIILEATSGNTGIALALITNAMGLRLEICIPKNASPERLNILRAYGIPLHLTDPLEGTDGAIIKARSLVKDNPNKYVYLDQYSNDANWLAHYHGTALEILQQTDRKITHFVACLGTSGTFMGVSKRLEEELPQINTISVQPDLPFHGLEGVKHMESAIVPRIYDADIASSNTTVSTEEAYENARLLAREMGILVGISSGAALAATRKLASNIESGTVVMIFPDRGDRYLTDSFWRF